MKARKVVPTILASLSPSKQDRVTIAKRIDEMTRYQAIRSTDTAMAKVAELLMAFPTAALSEVGANRRAQAFVDALSDLPTFAIIEACRKWLRGEAGEQNYSFAPSPPVLRQVAEGVLLIGRHEIVKLQRLLDAKVIPDPVAHSNEHREGMLKRLADLFRMQPAEKPKVEQQKVTTEGQEAAA